MSPNERRARYCSDCGKEIRGGATVALCVECLLTYEPVTA